ncbi:hypothetical protein L596_005809 [Steinernema carpocapsae]|uniref:Uncharacterized protein n=1 Tax=Steinernema carpocapsae TaxID=34508 RepID=A0A4U8V1M8_STECR|nr:hypothetical protein L596_005809 [Steinernema carpocapsae]
MAVLDSNEPLPEEEFGHSVTVIGDSVHDFSDLRVEERREGFMSEKAVMPERQRSASPAPSTLLKPKANIQRAQAAITSPLAATTAKKPENATWNIKNSGRSSEQPKTKMVFWKNGDNMVNNGIGIPCSYQRSFHNGNICALQRCTKLE